MRGVWLGALVAVIANTATAGTFRYEDLVTLIESENIASIETLLPRLPEALRANYTLVYDSGSLHEASPQNPRVILFGEDAQLTCAFNGDPSQSGFDLLECFQFREGSNVFDFREIAFPSARNQWTQAKFSDSDRSVDGTIRCSSCHGRDPRPNFDGYASWTGNYGSTADAIVIGSPEAANYAAFVSRRATHPRYSALIQENGGLAPYSAGSDQFSVKQRPNLRFSDFVGRMNGRRDGRLLMATLPRWQQLAYATGGLLCDLSVEQTEAILRAGKPIPNFNPEKISHDTGITIAEWTPQITPKATPTYEHQSGYSFLSLDVAMFVAQDLANNGNQPLRNGIAKILANSPRSHTGDELDYINKLNAILPDPDRFAALFFENISFLCPELSEQFTQEYLRNGP